MRYKTVLFDADGTLLDFERSEREALVETLLGVGIEPDEEKIKTYSLINDSLWKLLEQGKIERSVLMYSRFEMFCEKYGYKTDYKRMSDDYVKNISSKGYMLGGALELLERLDGKVRMYIITNGLAKVQRGRYARVGISRYFEDIFISQLVGVNKPDVRFFDYVAEHINGFDRESTVVVGDSLTSDIKGANNAGLDSCWYNPQKKRLSDAASPTYTAHSFDEVYDIISNGGIL